MRSVRAYFIAQFSFGNLSNEGVLHCAGIFAREVSHCFRERMVRFI